MHQRVFLRACVPPCSVDAQEVTGRTFMPLTECPSKRCRTNRVRSMLHLHTRGSKFLKFQEVACAILHNSLHAPACAHFALRHSPSSSNEPS